MTEQQDKSRNVKVSIVLLCYNHERFVSKALRAFEAQTFSDFELVVVDDCSQDDSLKIIRDWSSRTALEHQVISHEVNQGVCKSLNEAIQVASGEYVSMIATDDWADSNYLAEMVSALDSSSPETAFVYASVREVDEHGERLAQPHPTRDDDEVISSDRLGLFHTLLTKNVVAAPAVLVRKNSILEVGGYDESLVFEDYDMWLRLAFAFGGVHLKKTLVNYRVLASSMSRSSSLFELRKRSELEVLEKWIEATPQANALIAHRMRSICSELLAEKYYETAGRYLILANRLNPKFRWTAITALSRLRCTRWLVTGLFR